MARHTSPLYAASLRRGTNRSRGSPGQPPPRAVLPTCWSRRSQASRGVSRPGTRWRSGGGQRELAERGTAGRGRDPPRRRPRTTGMAPRPRCLRTSSGDPEPGAGPGWSAELLEGLMVLVRRLPPDQARGREAGHMGRLRRGAPAEAADRPGTTSGDKSVAREPPWRMPRPAGLTRGRLEGRGGIPRVGMGWRCSPRFAPLRCQHPTH